jgi:hypothetical protein
VFRIRIELIFRRCWNLITPSPVVQGSPPKCQAVPRISGRGLVGTSGRHLAKPAPAAFLESTRTIGERRGAVPAVLI